jgi:hypothetical protein
MVGFAGSEQRGDNVGTASENTRRAELGELCYRVRQEHYLSTGSGTRPMHRARKTWRGSIDRAGYYASIEQ